MKRNNIYLLSVLFTPLSWYVCPRSFKHLSERSVVRRVHILKVRDVASYRTKSCKSQLYVYFISFVLTCKADCTELSQIFCWVNLLFPSCSSKLVLSLSFWITSVRQTLHFTDQEEKFDIYALDERTKLIMRLFKMAYILL